MTDLELFREYLQELKDEFKAENKELRILHNKKLKLLKYHFKHSTLKSAYPLDKAIQKLRDEFQVLQQEFNNTVRQKYLDKIRDLKESYND